MVKGEDTHLCLNCGGDTKHPSQLCNNCFNALTVRHLSREEDVPDGFQPSDEFGNIISWQMDDDDE